MDMSYYDMVSLIRRGFHCFGDSFVCTLKHCKSSKQYLIYDKYGKDFVYYGFTCSYEEAGRILNFLRRRGHDTNYIVKRDCLLLPDARTGQLNLF